MRDKVDAINPIEFCQPRAARLKVTNMAKENLCIILTLLGIFIHLLHKLIIQELNQQQQTTENV